MHTRWIAVPISVVFLMVLLALPTDARAQPSLERLVQQAAEGVEPAARYELSLDEAVRLVLANNLDLTIERLVPRTFDFSIATLRAGYQPSLTSGFSSGNRVTLPNTQLATLGDSFETGTVFWNTGIRQNLKWNGASYAIEFNNQRTDSSNEFTSRNPSYSSAVNLSFTQPLLRGFRIDGARAQLRVSQIGREMSEVQLEATVINTLSNVRNAYWDYVYATGAAAISRESLALAAQLVEDNRERVRVGTMAPFDVVQSQAEEATRRQILAQDEALAQTAELTLKQLIVNGTDDPLWNATLVPTDRPEFRNEPIDVDTAVQNALADRTDLQQARRQLASNDVSLRQLENQTLPALDLNVDYGLTGLGGPEIIRSALGGTVNTTLPGGYSQALNNIRNLDAPNWNVGLTLSYPLGTSTAEANLARVRVLQQQTVAQVRLMELRVAAEVTNAALQVRSNVQRVQTASAARDLAQQRLEAVGTLFEVGRTENFFVVQAQRDLRSAQIAELRALVDYQKSLVNYDRSQRTSLTRAGITIIGGAGS